MRRIQLGWVAIEETQPYNDKQSTNMLEKKIVNHCILSTMKTTQRERKD